MTMRLKKKTLTALKTAQAVFIFIFFTLVFGCFYLLFEFEFKVYPLTWVDVFPEDPEFRVILKSDQTALLDTVHLKNKYS